MSARFLCCFLSCWLGVFTPGSAHAWQRAHCFLFGPHDLLLSVNGCYNAALHCCPVPDFNLSKILEKGGAGAEGQLVRSSLCCWSSGSSGRKGASPPSSAGSGCPTPSPLASGSGTLGNVNPRWLVRLDGWNACWQECGNAACGGYVLAASLQIWFGGVPWGHSR